MDTRERRASQQGQIRRAILGWRKCRIEIKEGDERRAWQARGEIKRFIHKVGAGAGRGLMHYLWAILDFNSNIITSPVVVVAGPMEIG